MDFSQIRVKSDKNQPFVRGWAPISKETRLSFEVFSLESLWTLGYVLAPLPPLGIGLSVAVREGWDEG